MTLLAGQPPGGGIDSEMRLVARFFGKFIPGEPSILPMNILVVGSDTRAALSDSAQFGGSLVGGARSDTIMIVHLDPATESLKDAARAWAGGTGVDLVVDPIGGALAEPSLRALGDRGRYLVIGFASGDIPSVPLNQVLLRNRSVIGIDWGIWAMTHPAEQRSLLDDLLAMVGAGTLDPVRPTEYPLDNVSGALEDLLGRRAVGKIALVP